MEGLSHEGVVRDERYETAQLAVDPHGYTDVAMALARGVGLDLCPRLKELSDRHLFLPRGSDIPENLKAICHATLDPANLRGVFTFPIEQYQAQLLPSLPAAKSRALGG